MQAIEEHPSPNFGPRRGGAAPDMIVLHYTGMIDAESALDRLRDPAAEVSAHYMICTDGRTIRMVADEMRAWHAGVSRWGPVEDVNSRSIGVELVNPGHDLGYPPFPEPQMAALEALLADLIERHGIAPERVLGHACIAPGRKRDPGEKFDWRRLGLGGLAAWLDPQPGPVREGDATDFQAAAATFGYPVPDSGCWCEATCAVWQAFAMRFLPAQCGEPPGAAGVAHLARLAARWPCRS